MPDEPRYRDYPDPFVADGEDPYLIVDNLRPVGKKPEHRMVKTIDHRKQMAIYAEHGDPERTGVFYGKSARKKPVNHNKRAEDLFVSHGYSWYKCESYNAFSGRKADFLGIFDAVALSKVNGIVGVQVTSWDHRLARVKKMKASPALAEWLGAGGKAVVLSFKKLANGRYEPNIIEVKL